jgi:hypothetical protein
MHSKATFAPEILVVLGAFFLALFFDAHRLVWIVGAVAACALIAYEWARYKKMIDIFFGIPLAFLFFGAWEFFSVVYGMRALQLAHTAIIACLLIILTAICAWMVSQISALGRVVLGALLGAWSLVLLFAPTSFFALGMGAAGIFIILAITIHDIETHAPRKNVIAHISAGLVVLIGFGVSFRWFL